MARSEVATRSSGAIAQRVSSAAISSASGTASATHTTTPISSAWRARPASGSAGRATWRMPARMRVSAVDLAHSGAS